MASSWMVPANKQSCIGDASFSSEDDVLISVTRTLAKEACVLLQLGKYADCLKVLHKLLRKKQDDPQILRNLVPVGSIQGGFSNPKSFVEALNNLKKIIESLDDSSAENAEVVNNESEAVGNKGADSVPDQVSATDCSQGIVDGFDFSVITFNIAVIFYHLQEYDKCFAVLERLYQNIQPIDERVAHHICLLLLDVALICHCLSRAADVINYLERVAGKSLGSEGDAGSFTQKQQSTSLVTKSTSVPCNVTPSDAINSEVVEASGPESSLSRTLSEESLYEALMSTFDKNGSHDQTRPSKDLRRTQADESLITIHDLRPKLHLYKVRVFLSVLNLKEAKRELKIAMKIAHGKDHCLALFLKSQLEYTRGNHRKAIKLLMASSNQIEMVTLTLIYNNLGCIYYQLGQLQTSAGFFSKALRISSPLRKERPQKLLSISRDKSLFFVYNCALVYMASEKPLLAVRCFQKAGSVFFKRPLLWLRIAECCMMAPEKDSDIKVHIVGKGKWRQLVIESCNSRNLLQVEPNLSLTNAKSCLLNALYLLDCSDESKPDLRSNLGPDESSNPVAAGATVVSPSQVNPSMEIKESKVRNSCVNVLLLSSINEYEGLRGKENQMILQAVLADLAFVYLELGNALKALAAAKRLMRLPECSRIYIFLGNLYAAEAYCLLNQPKQASEHLSSYISRGLNNAELPFSQEDCRTDSREPNVNNTPSEDKSLSQSSPFFLKPEEARGYLLANIAALAAAQGDINRAHEAAALALSAIPNSLEVVLTATYIDLVCGNTQEAITKLKECSQVRFLPQTSACMGS